MRIYFNQKMGNNKDNKVGNIEDLAHQSRENSNQKLAEKNDLNICVKKDDEAKESNDKKVKKKEV